MEKPIILIKVVCQHMYIGLLMYVNISPLGLYVYLTKFVLAVKIKRL